MQSVTASDSGNEAMGDLVALPCNFRISVETDRKKPGFYPRLFIWKGYTLMIVCAA